MAKTTRKTGTAQKPRKGAPPVRVRMYRQGLGDCFLLTFGTAPAARHMLIDCGTLGATTTPANTLKKVVADIANQTGNRLSIVVASHEHKDHLSGFSSQEDAFRRMIPVDHVWLAWTEDPHDDQAKAIKIYQRDLALALGAAVGNPSLKDGAAVRDMLGFAGDPEALGAADKFAQTIDQAMKFVRDELGGDVAFHKPGAGPLELPEIPGFRFYVLGPPRSEDSLKDLGEHGSSHLYGLRAAAMAHDPARQSAPLAPGDADWCELEMPFDGRYRREFGNRRQPGFAGYYNPANKWRRIEGAWLGGASDMALQLDSLTNNTSLALAIERIADGRVLLFPADSQQGNWLSWQKLTWKVKDAGGAARDVRASELLNRTVFYKVGHHCSHNATARAEGLEMMEKQAELVAFIPVDRAVAIQKSPPGSWKMPARPLYRRLLERCQGRVVRSDLGWAADSATARNRKVEKELDGLASKQEWGDWTKKQAAAEKAGRVTITDLFVDFHLA